MTAAPFPEVSAELIETTDQATPWLPPATVHQSVCLLCGARSPHVPERSMAHVDAVDHYFDFHEIEETP